jgi:chromosome segregation ATPase
MNEQQLDMIEGLQDSVKSVEQHRLAAEARMKELSQSVSAVNMNLQQIARFQNLITGVRLDFEGRFDRVDARFEDLEQRLLDMEQQMAKLESARYRVPNLPSRQIDRPVNKEP